MHDESDRPRFPDGPSLPVRAATVAAVTLLFVAVAAWPVPDVNEAVYLTKARHFADPTWGRGDFFLETRDAHGGFYLFFGPLAAALPLDTAAWIGRWLGWLAVAAGFCHAAFPLLAPFAPEAGLKPAGTWRTASVVLLAAGLFSLALSHTTMAGEWVLGGCEAKVFAWGCVLAGIGEIARGRWAAGVLAMGAAAAFHVLVGGWGLVALAVSRLGVALGRSEADDGASRHPTPAWRTALCVVAGLGLVAWAVVPAVGLSAGADPATRAVAIRTYVVERLHHHLLPRTFPEPMVARHLLAVLVWWLLSRFVPATPARRRVLRFTLAALGISLAGWGIGLCEAWAPAEVLALLRYYWFRLADVVVPFALAATAALVVSDAGRCRRIVPLPPQVMRTLLLLAIAGHLAASATHWPLPGRTGLVPRADAKVDGPAWADICTWVRDHAPADACFLTPRGAASFTWRTGRREVVAWKNSPQDVAALVEWRRRILDCFSADGSLSGMERSTAALGVDRMRAVAERYDAGFAIVPADLAGLAELPFPVLHANDGYVVLDLRPPP
jgi:hypothetical protein